MFMIVQADSEEDAHLLCPDHIGPLQLLWEVSDTRIHFLDIEVFTGHSAGIPTALPILMLNKTRTTSLVKG
jgi:hypothetical protein